MVPALAGLYLTLNAPLVDCGIGLPEISLGVCRLAWTVKPALPSTYFFGSFLGPFISSLRKQYAFI